MLRSGGLLLIKGLLPMEKKYKINKEKDFREVFKVQINPGNRNFNPEVSKFVFPNGYIR